jgi:hypothetical protein
MKLWVTIWMWSFEEQAKSKFLGWLLGVLGQVLGLYHWVGVHWRYGGVFWTFVCMVLGWV